MVRRQDRASFARFATRSAIDFCHANNFGRLPMSQHAVFRGLATGSARGFPRTCDWLNTRFSEGLRPAQHAVFSRTCGFPRACVRRNTLFFRGLTTGGRRIGVQNVLGRSVPKSSVSLLKSFVSCKTFKRSARPSKRNVPIKKKRPCLRLRLRDDQKKRICLRLRLRDDQKKRFCLRTKRDSKKRSATRKRRNDSKKALRLEKGRNDQKRAIFRRHRVSSNEQKVKKYRRNFYSTRFLYSRIRTFSK